MNGSPIILIAYLLCAALGPITAANATEFVTEDALEGSVRKISQQLRCPVCQGETLYDSQSSLAAEMRDIIREQLAANRSESEIIAYFVDRYGDYVRLAPSLQGSQFVIWLIPFAVFLTGTVGVSIAILRRQKSSVDDQRS